LGETIVGGILLSNTFSGYVINEWMSSSQENPDLLLMERCGTLLEEWYLRVQTLRTVGISGLLFVRLEMKSLPSKSETLVSQGAIECKPALMLGMPGMVNNWS
jgi:hypothetical protein